MHDGFCYAQLAPSYLQWLVGTAATVWDIPLGQWTQTEEGVISGAFGLFDLDAALMGR